MTDTQPLVADADGHVLEPRSAWADVPAPQRPEIHRDAGGFEHVVVGDKEILAVPLAGCGDKGAVVRNAQEHIPQSAIAASTGTSARVGVTAFATTARPARATTTPVRLARRTTSVPTRSVAVPLTNRPRPAARPHVDSARPICAPRSNVAS